MQNSHALVTKDAFHIEIVYTECATHFAGSVIPNTWCPQPKAGIGNIELMTKSPRTALLYLDALEANISGAKLLFDKFSYGTALDKLRHGQAAHTKTGRNVQYVCFGTGSLQTKQVAIVYSHPVRRRNAHTNRSYAGDGMQRQHSAVKLLHKGFLLVICDRIAIVV